MASYIRFPSKCVYGLLFFFCFLFFCLFVGCCFFWGGGGGGGGISECEKMLILSIVRDVRREGEYVQSDYTDVKMRTYKAITLT